MKRLQKMASLLFNLSFASRPTFSQTVLTAFPLIIVLCHRGTTATALYRTTGIGALINDNTRLGKEARVAMNIAAQNFNNKSKYHKIFIEFRNTGGNPLQAAYIAEELTREKDVLALIGTETWEETALVAEVGNRVQVPVISLASAAISQSLKPLQWPYLVQMSSNVTEQIRCVAAIIRSFKWKKIIPIYELDRFGGDSGSFAALTEALQEIGVDIEYRLALPPFSSMLDPKGFIHQEVMELTSKNSRVFVILQSSISLATLLFDEAKDIGLIEEDSTWIMMEDIASQLQYLNSSSMSSMEGALGIKTYYSEENFAFRNFKHQFRQRFRSKYRNENNLDAGIYALRAHDTVAALARATTKLSTASTKSTTSNSLLKTILSDTFSGLIGDIKFENGELWQSPQYRVVNIVQNSSKDVGFWSPGFGFSKSFVSASSGDREVLAGSVKWPGGLINRYPKGWSMPSTQKQMKIGVPGGNSFDMFLKVEKCNASSEVPNCTLSGFCVDVFNEVVKILERSYPLPHYFVPYYGTYDELVKCVANQTFDAVVGDVTILAERSEHVEFTQPYLESGLSMIVPKINDKSWIFLKPFTNAMWAVTSAILIYTVFIVWLLERHSNPEFEGSWHNQLSTSLWFTSSSIFFAQKEQVRSNYTRVVAFVWFVVVLTLTTSYTANLSSLLTVGRLQPNVTDINWLLTHNATIGCDASSFLWKYLHNVLNFTYSNMMNISSEDNYLAAFKSGNITAAFLELPYEKEFLNQYCKRYTAPETNKLKGDRFGGFGFVFPKGSPIVDDASKAILTISEDGTLRRLHDKWFTPSSTCKTSVSTDLENTDRLSWKSFWGLFLFSAATSTISYILFMVHRFCERRSEAVDNGHYSVRKKLYTFVSNLYKDDSERNPTGTSTPPANIDQESIVDEGSSTFCLESLPEISTTPEHLQLISLEIEKGGRVN